MSVCYHSVRLPGPDLSLMQLHADSGYLRGARRVDSPNRDARPEGCAVDLVVVHGISLPPGEFGSGDIERLFTNALNPQAHPYFQEISDLRVSAHLLICRDGELVQFVPLHERAWHAGASCFEGRERCNDYSIGIELEGTDDLPYEAIQIERLVEVVRTLMAAFPGLTPERVVGHSDIAPGRKTDPGPHFDWVDFRARLARGAA